ncbi:N-acetyltransferase [Sinomicrobium kalidii]|uniref:GNAT family N-acetyltransferase n=1 Tax=Sinomicrobium kalidii TaxID=2900738 RepID=UPI001E55E110|nr:N-acetyltransferase [Sinomicrobium kalidii]UGU15569.1 N-acetyltransferase [Sinomicrobium kalidii]
MNEVAVKDNDFLRQFELRVSGKLAKIEYSSQEKKIFLTKLVFPEDLDDGFRDDFIESVLQIVEKRNLRVVPTSPEIARFLRKHKEYKDLLPVGIRI